MIAGATQVLRGTPADQVDPFKLAGALSGDSGWALVLGHQSQASDMLLLKGGKVLACARCTAKGHTALGVESVKERHRNRGNASETQVRLFQIPDLLLRQALIALRTPGYPTHIKTLRLIALLGHDADALPVRLWLHCGMHHPETGELEGYTPREIESIIRWRGKRGAAVRALLKTGFLDKSPNGYRVHNWLRHQGHIAVLKRRSLKANEVRWRKIDPDHRGPSKHTTSSSPQTKTRNPKRKRRSPPSLPSIPVQLNDPPPPLPARDRAQEETDEAAAAKGNPVEKPESADNAQFTPPVAAAPDNDLEKIIYDRIGWRRHVSRMDLQKVIDLKNKHGAQFFAACDRLHGGVRHLTAYLQAVLEPQSQTELISLKVKQMIDNMGVHYNT